MSSHTTISETLNGFKAQLREAADDTSLSKESFIQTAEGITGYINDLSPFKFMDNLGNIRSIHTLLEDQKARFSITPAKKETQKLEDRTEVWPRGEIKDLHLRLLELEEVGHIEQAKVLADEIEDLVDNLSPFKMHDSEAFINSLRERVEKTQAPPLKTVEDAELGEIKESLDMDEKIEDVELEKAEDNDVPFWKKAVAVGLIGLVLVAPFLAIPGLMMTRPNNTQPLMLDGPRNGTSLIPWDGSNLSDPLLTPPQMTDLSQTGAYSNGTSAMVTNPFTPQTLSFQENGVVPHHSPVLGEPVGTTPFVPYVDPALLNGNEVVVHGTEFQDAPTVHQVVPQLTSVSGSQIPIDPSKLPQNTEFPVHFVHPTSVKEGSMVPYEMQDVETDTTPIHYDTSQSGKQEVTTYSPGVDKIMHFNAADFQVSPQRILNIGNLEQAVFQFKYGNSQIILDLKNPDVQKALSTLSGSSTSQQLGGNQEGLAISRSQQPQESTIFFIEDGVKQQMSFTFDTNTLENLVRLLSNQESHNTFQMDTLQLVDPRTVSFEPQLLAQQKPSFQQRISNLFFRAQETPPILDEMQTTWKTNDAVRKDNALILPKYSPVELRNILGLDRQHNVTVVNNTETK